VILIQILQFSDLNTLHLHSSMSELRTLATKVSSDGFALPVFLILFFMLHGVNKRLNF